MATWEEQTSPLVKFEVSPAESFLSTPGEIYPSLFTASNTPASNTMNPMEIMTPPPFTEPKGETTASSSLAGTPDYSGTRAITPDSAPDFPATSPSSPNEKKPTKKRKSWGQVLPEPKTNLPPRKRAKTEDEKEQRRVERVLRNRRAAQSSRERKRQEVEALEYRNKELEARVLSIEKTNLLLLEELNKYRRTAGVVTRSSSPLDPLPSNPVTLTSELFSSQDGHKTLMDQLIFAEPSNSTVDPSSLSPKATAHRGEETPIEMELAQTTSATNESTPTSPSDKPSTELTQRPAVSTVGGSSSVVGGVSDVTSAVPGPVSLLVGTCFNLPAPADTDSYVLESGLLSSPNSVDFENDYMGGDPAALFPTDPFDLSQFLHEDGNGIVADTTVAGGQHVAAEAELGLHFADFETHFSSENLNLQPHSGASTTGCDDGGIAVGV